MKNLIYLSLSVLIITLAGCAGRNNESMIVLETSGYADSTKIYLVDTETTVDIDSGYIVNNRLVFNLEVDEPTRLMIRPVFKTREDFQVRFIWKEDSQLSVRAEKGNLKNAMVEGSVMQIQADLIKANKDKLSMLNDSLLRVYNSMEDRSSEEAKAIRVRGRGISKEITGVEVDYIKDNPDNIFSAITLKNLMTYTIPKAETEALYENLSEEVKSTKYGISIKNYLDLSRELKAGDRAVDFKMPDINGKMVGLSDFQGKYILLDFWSSGCGPCRLESPNLLRNYKEYRDKGFEIISITFDRDREAWEKAVKKDGMIWTTLFDSKGSDGDVIMTYSVFFMPTYYLIDPDGVIIDTWQGTGQLDKRLEEIFHIL
jgi:peroxiredoxin